MKLDVMKVSLPSPKLFELLNLTLRALSMRSKDGSDSLIEIWGLGMSTNRFCLTEHAQAKRMSSRKLEPDLGRTKSKLSRQDAKA